MSSSLNINTYSDRTSTQLERFYRSQILSDKLAPGTRLPSNKELARERSCSTAAVQSALATLAAEGLIERRQRRGTFVSNRNNKACIGILAGPDLVRSTSPFFRQLVARISDHLSSLYLTSRVYDNLDSLREGEISSTHDNLVADQKSYRFRGYILIGTSNVDDKVFNCGTAARAILMDVKRGSDLIIDYDLFIRDSLRELAARGERKITYVRSLPPEKASIPVPEIDSAARKHKLPKPGIWNLCKTSHHDSGNYESRIDEEIDSHFGSLSGDSLRRKLPDVYLVPDDIVARPLVINLLKRGISIPTDVRICVLTNSDYSLYYGVPVYRYEISMLEVVTFLCNKLNARLRGEKVDGPAHSMGGVFR